MEADRVSPSKNTIVSRDQFRRKFSGELQWLIAETVGECRESL